MALITIQSNREFKGEDIMVESIIPMKDDKCPKDDKGNVIPKSQVNLVGGGMIFCLTSRLKNVPKDLFEPRKARVSYEDVKVQSKFDKDGKPLANGQTREVDGNNIGAITFEQTVIEKAGQAGAPLFASAVGLKL